MAVRKIGKSPKRLSQAAIFKQVFDPNDEGIDISTHPAASAVLGRRDVYRRFLSHCLPQIQGADLDVYLDFVGLRDINAAASKSDDLYLIGLNLGTFDRLARLYSSLLSWPEVLPDVGDPRKEKPAKFDIVRCLNLGWQPRGTRTGPGTEQFLMPRDETRKMASIAMNVMALDFIFAHEFAHVYDAHVDYLGSQGAPLRLTETQGRLGNLTTEMRHAVEIEADMDATTMLASGLLHRLLIFQDFSKFFDEGTFLLLWEFAILLLFHAFDLTGSSVEEYRHEGHPHPEIRLLFVLSSLQAQARMGFKRNADGVMEPTSGRSDLEPVILACKDKAIASLGRAFNLVGLEKAVSANERLSPEAYLLEAQRMLGAIFKTLEPVRKFAKKKHLGVMFAVPTDWQP